MTQKVKEKILQYSILACLLLTVFFDYMDIAVFSNPKDDYFFSNVLALACGSVAITLLMKKENSKLFNKPTNLPFLLLGLIIAVDNFQFASFFAGKMQSFRAGALSWLLFITYCLMTGFFEETLFRGVVFPFLANKFEKNKKGLLKTIVYSSLIFGCAHLLNIFSGANIGATLLQACYSTLTGALFAFILIKTKNVITCAVTHGLYNFCGLLFSAEQGLGYGVVFDVATALTMLVVALIVFVFALCSFIKYNEEERVELYERLGFGVNQKNEKN